MNEGRLTLWIEGRKVIPVRAIPYITNSPQFKPDILVQRFNRNDPFQYSVFRKNWALETHRVQGTISLPVNPIEWDKIVPRIKRVNSIIKKSFSTTISNYAVWSIAATAALPAGWFVIYDEFVKTWEAERIGGISDKSPLANDKLTLSPALDAHTRAMVMEGFQWFIENEPENSNGLLLGAEQNSSGHEISIVPDKEGIRGASLEVLEAESREPEHESAPVNVLCQNVAQNNPSKTLTDESGASEKVNFPKQDPGQGLAALFDPVTVEALEKMFPSGNKWPVWADRAAENKLRKARVARRLFNPYQAAIWFLLRGIANWDLARCHRILANNLPARSKDKRYLLMDEEGYSRNFHELV
ncbi:MAG: hypothetical protein H0X43_13860 [Nitrosospira sp.]|nr:hypothetical protein [Nitrosospira sp.]